MLDYVMVAVALFLAMIIAVIYSYPGSSRATTIPGLQPSDDKDGNLADIGKAGSLHEFLMKLHEDYGPIASFWFGTQLTVSIASPELFKEHQLIFDRPPMLFKMFEPLFTPDGIQYANSGDGRKRRRLYDHSFSHEAVSQYYTVLNKIALQVADKLSKVPKGEHVPLKENMFHFSGRSILQVACGHHFNVEKQVETFRKYYDHCWSDMEHRLAGDNPASGSVREKKFERSKEGMFDLVTEVIKERREKPPANGEELLIDIIIKSGASDAVIVADVISFIIAGFHTTGLLLTWCIYFLASHPDIQEKVYKEVTEVLGDGDVGARAVSELVYTRQVIDESIRCGVLAPWAARIEERDMELGGHVVPGGTPVIHALGVVLQDGKLWPKPSVFDPDRFSPENREKMHFNAFVPFGFAGKRKCPGYRLAYAEATIALTVLLRKFKFTLVEGQVVTPVFGLVTQPGEEVWVTLEKRRNKVTQGSSTQS